MKISKELLIFFTFIIISVQIRKSTALLYIIRQNCVRGTVFTPPPSATSSICLQCVCVVSNIAYCKPVIVQLNVVCSAAATPAVVTAATTTTTTTARPLTIPTMATSPTTSAGINPRASVAPASGTTGVMNVAPMMMSMQPIMVMLMAAASGTGMPSMAPAPTAGRK